MWMVMISEKSNGIVKPKINCEDFVVMVSNFYERVRNKYMEIEGITRDEFMWRARMGIAKSETIFPMMPEGLQLKDKPNYLYYDIQYTDFKTKKSKAK